ncbi:MAG: hypothetical protein FJX47_17690, partial [Alphaproteobacteria bacterium]|nr:hypothetical protein [Alphaproteobacteria bacterium]
MSSFWTIRNSLATVIGLLSLFVFGLAAYVFLIAEEARGRAATGKAMSAISDDLLVAAGAWAVERGATNTALGGADPAPENLRNTMAAQRQRGDQAYRRAVAALQAGPEFGRKQDSLAAAAKAHDELTAIRGQADAAIQRPRAERDAKVVAEFIGYPTRMIDAATRLRVNSEARSDDVQVEFLAYQQAKHAGSTMAEFAGRERAFVTGFVSAGRALPPEAQQTLAGHRSKVEVAWDQMQAFGQRPVASPEIRAQIDVIRRVFMEEFQQVRQGVYAAGVAGTPYPISGPDWFAASTKAINEILKFAEVVGGASNAFDDRTLAGAIFREAVSLALIAGGLLLSVIAFMISNRRVSGAIVAMASAMGKLAEGDKQVVIPGAGRGD